MRKTITFRHVDLVTSAEGERFGRVGAELQIRRSELAVVTASSRPANIARVISQPLDQIKHVYTRGFLLKGRFGTQDRVDVLVIQASGEALILAPRLENGSAGTRVSDRYDGNRAREMAAEIASRLPLDANRPANAPPLPTRVDRATRSDAIGSSPGVSPVPGPTLPTTRVQLQAQRDVEFDRVDRVLSKEGERLRASFGTLSLRKGAVVFADSYFSIVDHPETKEVPYAEIVGASVRPFQIEPTASGRKAIEVIDIVTKNGALQFAPLAAWRQCLGLKEPLDKYDAARAGQVAAEIVRRLPTNEGSTPAPRADAAIDVAKNRLEMIKGIFARVDRIKLEHLAAVLEFDSEPALVKWLLTLPESLAFRIDSDHLVIKDADVDAFVAALDKEYASWEDKEKASDGKI